MLRKTPILVAYEAHSRGVAAFSDHFAARVRKI